MMLPLPGRDHECRKTSRQKRTMRRCRNIVCQVPETHSRGDVKRADGYGGLKLSEIDGLEHIFRSHQDIAISSDHGD